MIALALLLPLLVTTAEPPAPAPAPAPEATPDQRAPHVAEVILALDRPREDEDPQLRGYLADLIGRPATAATAAIATTRLEKLHRYRPSCRIVPKGEHTPLPALRCDVKRGRIIRAIDVEGLPASLLVGEVEKRVFLRPGDLFDAIDIAGRPQAARQAALVREHLDREGLLGAVVDVEAEDRPDGDVDVVVRIRGGAFARVRRVDLKSFGPLSQEKLIRAFGFMCASGEGLLDAAATGTLSCYTRPRLKTTLERFEKELAQLGYPEGRVKAEAKPVDPVVPGSRESGCGFSDDEMASFDQMKLPLPPRCLDVTVTVDAGPHLVAAMVIARGPRQLIEIPDLLAPVGLNLMVPVEASSRWLQRIIRDDDDSAWDTNLYIDELTKVLTFSESRSTDDTEVLLSADALEQKLGKRGFPDARVKATRTVLKNGDVSVLFEIDPGPGGALTAVRLVGNESISADEVFDEVELAAKQRSWKESGFAAQAEILDDEVRLRAFFASRGFTEANVTSTLVRDKPGSLEVMFRIEEGERFIISQILFVGGVPALLPQILAAIEHCKQGPAALERRAPQTPADCIGSPFLPAAIDADVQRVLNVYVQNGHPHVRARIDTGFTELGTLLRVVVEPAENARAKDGRPVDPTAPPEQVRLGQIFLDGNEDTLRSVLLREMDLDDAEPGAPLRPLDLAEGVSRLRRTGLFSRVNLEYLNLDEDTTHVDVRLNVQERPALTLDTSVGFSTEDLFSVRTEARHRNIFGSMFDGTAALDLGLFIGRHSLAETGLRWPRINGSEFTVSIGANVLYDDEPAGARKLRPAGDGAQHAYSLWAQPDLRRRLFRLGTTVGLEWRLLRELALGVSYEFRFEWNNLLAPPIEAFSFEAFRTVDGMLAAFDADLLQVGAITPTITYTNVDNLFDPSFGFAGDLFLKGSAPFLGAADFYGVVGGAARAYYTLFERFTFASSFRLRYGLARDVEICDECEWAYMQSDLLLLGGQRSVRGYPENGIGVLGELYDARLKSLNTIGTHAGTFNLVWNLELRTTLIKRLFIGDVKPAIFTDFGVSTDRFDIPAPDPFLDYFGRLKEDRRFGWSVGAGLRYVLPVGPASVDCAVSPLHDALDGSGPQWGCHALFGYIF